MRFKRNSHLDFSPELQVMGDKAEELGYKWDRSQYPTPAWELLFPENSPHVNMSQFSIPLHQWKKEVISWLIACIEKVVPIWENWADINFPETKNDVRNSITILDSYALGTTDFRTALRDSERNNYRVKAIQFESDNLVVGSEDRNAALTAALVLKSATPLINSVDSCAASAAIAASYAAVKRSSLYGTERLWQQKELANRIDKIAPWRL